MGRVLKKSVLWRKCGALYEPSPLQRAVTAKLPENLTDRSLQTYRIGKMLSHKETQTARSSGTGLSLLYCSLLCALLCVLCCVLSSLCCLLYIVRASPLGPIFSFTHRAEHRTAAAAERAYTQQLCK